MTKRITLNTFRKVERAEETMMRACMPLTSAADPAPLVTEIAPAPQQRPTWRAGVRVAPKPLTFTLREVL